MKHIQEFQTTLQKIAQTQIFLPTLEEQIIKWNTWNLKVSKLKWEIIQNNVLKELGLSINRL